jgi:hypothetical protein
MSDYTPYVLAVYGIALVAYGGATLYWQWQLRRINNALRRMQEDSAS